VRGVPAGMCQSRVPGRAFSFAVENTVEIDRADTDGCRGRRADCGHATYANATKLTSNATPDNTRARRTPDGTRLTISPACRITALGRRTRGASRSQPVTLGYGASSRCTPHAWQPPSVYPTTTTPPAAIPPNRPKITSLAPLSARWRRLNSELIQATRRLGVRVAGAFGAAKRQHGGGRVLEEEVTIVIHPGCRYSSSLVHRQRTRVRPPQIAQPE